MRILFVLVPAVLFAGCTGQKKVPAEIDYSLPMTEYKSRLTATDPGRWKCVRMNVAAPTGGVTVAEGGIFKTALERNTHYLLTSFSLDHMLEPFRVRAGLPFKPDTLPQIGFWDTDLRGSNAGRFLMGAGNTLRWSDDSKLRGHLNKLIDGIEECRRPDGYILPYPPDSPRSEEPNYARAWLTHGLIDAAIAGNSKAYGLLRGHADWFNKWNDMHPKLLYWANNNHQGHIASTRTYLSPVGKPEDLQVAEKYYVCDWWMNELAARRDKAVWQYPLQNPHSYLITSFEAYLDHYIATGDKNYLEAMQGAWELIHNKWEHVGGSIAICESQWEVKDGKRKLKHWGKDGISGYPPSSYYVSGTEHTGETCGSSFWMKFNQRLHLLFPEQEKYMAAIEKSIYNVVLSAQTKEGRIRYHAFMQGAKESPGIVNTCCEGQGTRILGTLPEYIYTIASDGLYVNLYEPSAIRWNVNDQPVNLKLESEFPFKPGVKIAISTASPVKMKLRIRVPSWATKHMVISVNGRRSAAGDPGTYVELSRTWKDGDSISFILPMELKTTRYVGIDTLPSCDRYAVEYGPVLLASVGHKQFPDVINSSNLQDKLIADPSRPLHFSVADDPDHMFMPYWIISDKEFCVFPVVKKDIRRLDELITSPDGFATTFYNNTEWKGNPVHKGTTKKLDFEGQNGKAATAIAPGVNLTDFSSRFEGKFISPITGIALFYIISDDGHKFYVNDNILSEMKDRTQSRITCYMNVEEGKEYRLKLEHVQQKGRTRIALDGIIYKTSTN